MMTTSGGCTWSGLTGFTHSWTADGSKCAWCGAPNPNADTYVERDVVKTRDATWEGDDDI